MKDMSKMEGTTNIFRGARPPPPYFTTDLRHWVQRRKVFF